MSVSDLQALAETMGDLLESKSDEIVDRWIDWLNEQIGTRTIKSLPRQELLDHIPPVVRSLAQYVRSPVQAVRAEMLGHLRLHAQIRRSQGYDIQELLAEFDGLGRLITAEIVEVVEQREAATSAADALRVFARVADGFRAIGFATVGLYRESEDDHQRRTAKRLEEFSRAIAHELRAPLNTASLAAELLASDDVAVDPNQRTRHTDIIKKALHRTNDLLDDVRILAVVERGVSSFRYAHLATVVHDVLEELAVPASQRGVYMTVEGPLPEVDVAVMPTQLALVNTISNAIKYADVTKDEPKVVISAHIVEHETKQDHCVIEVKDNGLGIDEQYLERVFERHVRVHPDVAEGTGLGLPITRQILMDNQGSIELESTVGEGTTVRINIAVTDARQPYLRGAAREPYDLLKDTVESAIEDKKQLDAKDE